MRILNLSIAVLALTLASSAWADDTSDLFTQEGIASWYGAEFEGRATASGERFNASDLTAAHPTLPFGTLLKITNKQNGKSVVVRVNDRGPFVAARIIDISRGAAEKIDMVVTGTAPVKVESLAPVRTETILASKPPASEPVTGASKTEPIKVTVTIDTGMAHQGQAVVINPAPAPAVSDPSPDPVSAELETDESPLPIQASAKVSITASPRIAAPIPAAIVPEKPDPANGKFYRLQVGSYRIESNAAEAFDILSKAGLSPAYERMDEFYRVVLVRIPSSAIDGQALILGGLGFTEVLAREER